MAGSSLKLTDDASCRPATAGVRTWSSSAAGYAKPAAAEMFDVLCPGGRVVLVGMPGWSRCRYDVSQGAQVKEARIENVFRYAHVYPRALALMAAGKIDVKPLITDTFDFSDGVEAFDFACKMPATSVKAQIVLD